MRMHISYHTGNPIRPVLDFGVPALPVSAEHLLQRSTILWRDRTGICRLCKLRAVCQGAGLALGTVRDVQT